ncbi:serine--tRNA ligase [Buchnera aphidicola]|uniref:serine--tRNA ligase n=1 Tax=Buchnera aphidicola TaxID=9 RepID=UPI0031B8A925
MIDPYSLRNNIEDIAILFKKRGFFLDIKKIKLLEKKRKNLQLIVENFRSKYKKISKLIYKEKKNQLTVDNLKKQVKEIKKNLLNQEIEFQKVKKKINLFFSMLPNIPDKNVPIGRSYHDNKIIKYWGKIKNYSFSALDHVSLGKKINGFDWFTASNMSGARFVIIKDQLSLLYRALGQFMLDIHTMQHGYKEIHVPYLVNNDSMYGAGQLPKFQKELFYVSTKNNIKKKYILIPTAEVPLTNLFRNAILQEDDLPIMLVAQSPCFRAESLSYGKDTKGLIRMHQFDKVELFQITHPKDSMLHLEKLTSHAEKILKLLKLPYRKLLLCTGDMGFAATKTYDLEVWFPSCNCYKEISSCSNMSDFQTRRINAKYFQKNKKKKYFLHTINGSGLAIGRTLAAILENYQCNDGKIEIPEILSKKYMNGIKFIT